MRIHLKTFGCQYNQAESEQIAGMLSEHLEQDERNADAIIINSCSVKSKVHNKIVNLAKELSQTKKVFITGCLPSVVDFKGVKNITVLKGIKDIQNVFNLKPSRPLRKNKDIAIVQIAKGCLNSCTYCSTKLARDQLKSKTKSNILKEIKKSVGEGCKIIHLTSQDNGCYGFDIKTSLPKILEEILRINSDFKVKIGMMNPQYVLKMLSELVGLYKNEKIIKFLHIPIQSGSDKILKDMKRGYKVNDFKRIVQTFRKEIPGINISTDIIVGYPTETEEDFQATTNLIKEIKPEVLNLSRFSPRPRTEAAKLKQLPSQEVKRRSVLLNGIFKDIKTF